MEYARESLDRIEKIKKLRNAQVIVYANNYHGKTDIKDIHSDISKAKDVEKLMEI